MRYWFLHIENGSTHPSSFRALCKSRPLRFSCKSEEIGYLVQIVIKKEMLWSIKFDLSQIIGYILFQDDVISCTLFFSAFFILRTSMTSTTIAIKRPNSVQINTPPRDRRVMPSESSKIGQSLLFVLFQYFPNKNYWLKHFCGIDVLVLLSCILNKHRILCTRKFFKIKLFLQT